MDPLGRHILLELEECHFKILNDLKKVEAVLLEAARLANATIIESRFHYFSPLGISGVVVIAESHFTIHTWPEFDYAAVDIFTCGKRLEPKLATEYMIRTFGSKKPAVVAIERGSLSTDEKFSQSNISSEEDPREQVFG